MLPLDQDLQTPKDNLEDFANLSIRVLNHLTNVLSDSEIKGKYIIHNSVIADNVKYLRPINRELILFEEDSFRNHFEQFRRIISRLKKRKLDFNQEDFFIVDRTLYSIQQLMGCGLDLLVNPNSARKHVGNRFEELMRTLFTETGITNKRIVLKIPYETEEGEAIYRCENDLILSPYEKVRSTEHLLDENEIVVSAKTTSKDRMGKMFMDKILLENFLGHPQKVIGIFQNDVQRKGENNISYTLVSGLFMVYSRFLTELDGVYYMDPPPNAYKAAHKHNMYQFSRLLLEDIWKMLAT
ncbi:MAG: hypothetical protein KGY70_12225 [Bacteroidales bacterium]|nr:hypothetical protein [Bacteroidales bacterium]